MERERESTLIAAQTGYERVIVPTLRVIAWSALFGVLLAWLILGNDAEAGREPLISYVLFRHGLLPLGFGFGFLGMLLLPFWEKLGLFGAMLVLAWLTG